MDDPLQPFMTREAREALFAEFKRRTGATPGNHLVVVKRTLLREHPDLAQKLFEALEAPKQIAYQEAQEMAAA